MHRHLVTTDILLADTCVLGKEEARHLQTVLRVKPGDKIQLFDGEGHTRLVVVSIPPHFMKCGGMDAEPKTSKNSLCLTAIEPAINHPKPICSITLFVCISKGKHMDLTIEKAVELGVARIVPVISDRTIVRVDADDREAKADRWMRIAEEAARQSGRAWLPEILTPRSFKESLALVQQTTPTFVAALTPDAKPLRDFLLPGTRGSGVGVQGSGRAWVSDPAKARSENVALPPSLIACPHSADMPTPSQAGWFVGPEGDFTPDELQRLLDAGALPVSLGPLVLRAETACLYGLCALNCAWM
jgi:16S rRNA (uracil1498-N3)-methyltransferase